MAYSANQEQVFSPLDQSGVSNFASVKGKLRKNALCFDQSAFSNFAPYVIRTFITFRQGLYSSSVPPPPPPPTLTSETIHAVDNSLCGGLNVLQPIHFVHWIKLSALSTTGGGYNCHIF